MPDLVVDASIALAWGLPDESSSYAVTVLEAVEQHVPALWAWRRSMPEWRAQPSLQEPQCLWRKARTAQ
jgi:hypothetical protein